MVGWQTTFFEDKLSSIYTQREQHCVDPNTAKKLIVASQRNNRAEEGIIAVL